MVGDNQALITNDGVRSKNENLNAQDTGSSGTAQSNRLMDLNSGDIENVSILKGAASNCSMWYSWIWWRNLWRKY